MGAGEERPPFSLHKGKPDPSERQARGNPDALQGRRLRPTEKAANRPTLNKTTANGKAGGGTEIAARGQSGA